MFYPDAKRLKTKDTKEFFIKELKPRIPRAVALWNDNGSKDDGVIWNIDIAQLSSNIQHTVLLSL